MPPPDWDDDDDRDDPQPCDLDDDESDEATVTCPACGKQYHEDAPCCPKCGWFRGAESAASRRASGWFWPAIVAILIGLILVTWHGLGR